VTTNGGPLTRIAKDVAHMMTGTAVAQALPLLVTPILARQYAPEQFGEFGVFTTLVLGLSLVVSGRYEIAVPLPRCPGRAFRLFSLSVLLAIASSALLAALCAWVLVAGASDSLPASLTDFTLVVLAPAVLISSLAQSCSYWLTRSGRFRAIAFARAAQGVSTAASGVAFGAFGIAHGLVWSLLLGQSVSLLIAAAAVVRHDRYRIRRIRFNGLRGAARAYREFPLVNAAHAGVDTIRDSGTLLIFSALFGTAAAGQLTQAMRILRAPMSLIGQSVAQVMFPRVSATVASGQSPTGVVKPVATTIAAVSAVFYSIVFLAGPWLFTTVLGDEWAEAGTYARILAPWLAVVLVASTLSLLPVIFRRQTAALALNVGDTALRLTGLVVGSLLGPIGAVTGLTVTGLMAGSIQLVWYRALVRNAAARASRRAPLEGST